jgi:hypothetical protein
MYTADTWAEFAKQELWHDTAPIDNENQILRRGLEEDAILGWEFSRVE